MSFISHIGRIVMAYVPYMMVFGATVIVVVPALIYMLVYKDDHRR